MTLSHVKAGETVKLPHGEDQGGKIVKVPHPYTVQPKCDAENRTTVIVCVTHGEYLETDAEYEKHTAKGSHKIAHVCNVHGVPEE